MAKEESEKEVKCIEEKWKASFLNFNKKNKEEVRIANKGIASLSKKLTREETEKRQTLRNSQGSVQIM